MRPGVQVQPGQHGENPSLLKIQKLSGLDDTHLWSQLLRQPKQENHLNPGARGCSEQSMPLHSSLGDTARFYIKRKKMFVQDIDLENRKAGNDYYEVYS